MTTRVLEFSRTGHRYVQDLLPWYASGAIEDSERRIVETHLGECAECQRQLRWHQALREAIAATGPAGAEPQAALAKLQPRLDASGRPLRRVWAWARAILQGRAPAPGWLGYALAAQACLIVALAWVLERPGAESSYHTLSQAAPAANAQPSIVVVFDPELPEKELRRILRSTDTRIVAGPTDAGAYLLAAQGRDVSAALGALRARKGVRFAERLGPMTP